MDFDNNVLASLKLPCTYLNRNVSVDTSLKLNIQNNNDKFKALNKCQEKIEQNKILKLEHSLLKSPGPNKYAMTLITKYKRNTASNSKLNEIVLDEATKAPIVQILAFKKDESKHFWLIPSGHVRKNNPNRSKRKNCQFKSQFDKDKSSFMKRLYDKIFVDPKIVYNGYLNDGRNSDESWIEIIAENCHHFTDDVPNIIDEALTNLTNFDTDKNICLKWIDIYDKYVYPPHRIVLKNCALHLNAKWIDFDHPETV